ncbi:MAG: hypothetical protein J6D47_21035 [Peptostreptococcaceae bacterium]|nr:hypothetical protein [Peptostreptococcaceae bacterium]
MKLEQFNKIVDNYCKGKGIRFTDELGEVYQHQHEGYKYYFVYTSNSNVNNAFKNKQEVIDFIRLDKK